MATTRATWAYRDRFGDGFGRTYFRRFGPGVVSSIGLGTYLGDPTDAVDDDYERALIAGFEGGCNVVDTAVNYRCGRSERVVGRAIERADVDREAVVVATKGGFLPFDGERPADPTDYIREQFVDGGPVDPTDLAADYHCIAPDAIEALLDRSLDALGLETIDCYYVHNPETQLRARSREDVYDQLEATFERLERRVAAGDIGRYGVATWQAFRVPPEADAHLSLPEVAARARSAAATVGRAETGFEAIQLPFNVHMADAFTAEVHEFEGEYRSALSVAQTLDLDVFTSASLAQGDLLTGLPAAVDAELSGDTPAQRAINFARSAPAVTCALVGASDPDHVAEDVAAGTFDPLGARAFDAVFT
ncbi:aldo/keto reductase [Haloplanus aerogenes]|uniref:Aldo/keto reductase n=1 Tax=Haloplanus aerogenes TaxID=660522 RepID=A0A3M0CXF0_9EURY|nr:aldo/keto reductase [Haloplanus aerogenes]AZH24952.1 aldo/keto reductase [Haloplanus aerogenes]RMB13831.1 aryl-alcohol dehydrogenase-like predicted oxidoreductase [Haloplanus aerogenes]